MSLLPPIFQDISNLALEKCALLVLKLDIKRYMPLCIDYLDEKYLYYLAENFHITGDEGWNFATTVQEKRNLLKIAFKKHMKKGAISALDSVFNALNLSGKFQKWDEYGGRPGRFRVVIDFTNKMFNAAIVSRLSRLIELTKRKSAILDSKKGVHVNVRYDGNLCLLPTLIVRERIYIPDEIYKPLDLTDFYGEVDTVWADENTDLENQGYWAIAN